MNLRKILGFGVSSSRQASLDREAVHRSHLKRLKAVYDGLRQLDVVETEFPVTGNTVDEWRKAIRGQMIEISEGEILAVAGEFGCDVTASGKSLRWTYFTTICVDSGGCITEYVTPNNHTHEWHKGPCIMFPGEVFDGEVMFYRIDEADLITGIVLGRKALALGIKKRAGKVPEEVVTLPVPPWVFAQVNSYEPAEGVPMSVAMFKSQATRLAQEFLRQLNDTVE